MQLKRHFRAGRRPREAVMTFLGGNPIGWGLGGGVLLQQTCRVGDGRGKHRFNHDKAVVPIQGQVGKSQTAVQAWSFQSRLSGAFRDRKKDFQVYITFTKHCLKNKQVCLSTCLYVFAWGSICTCVHLDTCVRCMWRPDVHCCVSL